MPYTDWNQLPLMITVSTAAKVVGVNRVRMYELVRTPGFPALFIGKRIVISRDGLRRWINEQESKKLAV